MHNIQPQEKNIYDRLNPLFKGHGYTLIHSRKQFVLPTRNGFRTALISIDGNQHEQTVDFKLGVRFDVVEELANQFLAGLTAGCKETTTILTSYSRFCKQPHKRFLIRNQTELDEMCKRMDSFMRNRGFKFLESFDRLRKLDGIMNRKPEQPCLFLQNQVNRCFKATIIAKLVHRTDFNRLVRSYLNFLQTQWMNQELISNYKKMVKFLRYYSIN